MASQFSTSRVDRTSFPRSLIDALTPFGTFLSEFVRQPGAVGSPIPSSQRVVDTLLAGVDWPRVDLLVEYGPGTGCFTAGALRRMRRDATLIAIDTSPGFTRYLKSAIPDSRLRPVTASAAAVAEVIAGQGFDKADCIISGLPFSTLPEGEGEAIVGASHEVLSRDGLFLAYQVRSRICSLLEARFIKVAESYEWLNLPPYHLYWFRKDGGV